MRYHDPLANWTGTYAAFLSEIVGTDEVRAASLRLLEVASYPGLYDLADADEDTRRTELEARARHFLGASGFGQAPRSLALPVAIDWLFNSAYAPTAEACIQELAALAIREEQEDPEMVDHLNEFNVLRDYLDDGVDPDELIDAYQEAVERMQEWVNGTIRTHRHEWRVLSQFSSSSL